MQSEQECIEMLQSLMGGDLEADVAKRVLMKHSFNLEASASAILEGDRGEEQLSAWHQDTIDLTEPGVLNASGRPNTPMATEAPISSLPVPKDASLLADPYDPDLNRALQMSLETNQSSNFKKTDRAPDPNWQVVPSNVPMNNIQEQEDHSLNRAIEASLSTSFVEDRYEDLSLEERARKPGLPLALRTQESDLHFVTLVLQTLLHVQQVRDRLALWRWQSYETDSSPPENDPVEKFIFNIQMLGAYMDMSVSSYVKLDALNLAYLYDGRRALTASDKPGPLSKEFFVFLASILGKAVDEHEQILNADENRLRNLFVFRYDILRDPMSMDIDSGPSGTDSMIIVHIREDANDLVSSLTLQLGLETPDDSMQYSASILPTRVLVEPSEVLVFFLVKHELPDRNASQSSTTEPYRYPMQLYLDQFMQESYALASEKRDIRKQLKKSLQELIAKKEGLMNHKGKSPITFLTSALHYHESVASNDGSEERKKELEKTSTALRSILDQIDSTVKSIDAKVMQLQNQIDGVFDDPELQKHRYVLRAVLMHDGLFGRNHIHSFVHHGGRWWKTQDANVVEVSEEVVMTDASGLHLGAGPYMLVYSRETDDADLRVTWPSFCRRQIKADNDCFIDELSETDSQTASVLKQWIEETWPFVEVENLPRAASVMVIDTPPDAMSGEDA